MRGLSSSKNNQEHPIQLCVMVPRNTCKFESMNLTPKRSVLITPLPPPPIMLSNPHPRHIPPTITPGCGSGGGQCVQFVPPFLPGEFKHLPKSHSKLPKIGLRSCMQTKLSLKPFLEKFPKPGPGPGPVAFTHGCSSL